MGVDHGGNSRNKSPRIWSRGRYVAKANCPPQISSYRYKNECSVAFKIRQNPFSDGALPRTPLGSSRRSPDPLVGWGGDTPPHTLPHSAPTHFRRSPCVPPEFQPDLRLWRKLIHFRLSEHEMGTRAAPVCDRLAVTRRCCLRLMFIAYRGVCSC